MRILFHVNETPVAQPRPRFSKVGGFVKVREADKGHPIFEYKDAAREAARRAYRGKLLDGPLGIQLVFLMPRPKARVWKKKPMPREWDSRKTNDVDNLTKAVYDALTGTIWDDDGRVSTSLNFRLLAAGHEPPHVEVLIWRLDNVHTDSPRAGDNRLDVAKPHDGRSGN